jgi:hypothetical protein
MAISEELQILVDAKVSQAVKDMKKVDKSIDGTSKTAGKLKDVLKTLAGPIAIGAVIAGVVKLGKESEQAFQVQEEAIAGLNAALKATGQFTEAASQDIQEYAAELQELTVVGDEATIAMVQTAINMGLTADEAKKAAKQAIGMSEAYGVGLQTALRGTANAALGNFDALTRYLPAIKTVTTAAEKQAIVNEQLAASFEVAAANALTAAGVQQQLNNNYGDLQETIGGVISQAMTPFRAALSKEIVSVNKSITAHILRKKALNGEATLIEELTLKQLQYEKTENTLAAAKRSLALEIAAVSKNRSIDDALAQMNAANSEANVRALQNEVIALEDSLVLKKLGIKTAEDAVKADRERIEANILLAQAINGVNLETENNTKANVENKESIEEVQFSHADMVAEAMFDLREYGRATEEVTEEALLNWENLAKVGMGAITSGFVDIGEALVKGKLGIEDFGKLFLNSISSVLQALGAELAALAAVQLLLGNVPGAAVGAVASASAYTAAGVVKGLASFGEGGSFTTNGPTPIMVGDNIGGREEVTVRPISSKGANERPDSGGAMILNIDGQQFLGWVQSKLDNGNLRVPRRIIA